MQNTASLPWVEKIKQWMNPISCFTQQPNRGKWWIPNKGPKQKRWNTVFQTLLSLEAGIWSFFGLLFWTQKVGVVITAGCWHDTQAQHVDLVCVRLLVLQVTSNFDGVQIYNVLLVSLLKRGIYELRPNGLYCTDFDTRWWFPVIQKQPLHSTHLPLQTQSIV